MFLLPRLFGPLFVPVIQQAAAQAIVRCMIKCFGAEIAANVPFCVGCCGAFKLEKGREP